METKTTFKPMLAVEASIEDIRFPVLASPKLDGIRATMVDGKALTRSLKPIPNHHVRMWLEANCPNGWDGELMLPRRADGTLPDFNEVQSAIMSRDGEPDFCFHVFDNHLAPGTFEQRLNQVRPAPESLRLKKVVHYFVKTREQLEEIIDIHLAQGFEGTMVRDPNGPYKFGRSTLKEGYLLKIKPTLEDEGLVVGYAPLFRNGNQQTRDERGYAKRSKRKEGLVQTELLGLLILRLPDGREFEVGSGFTEAQRADLWQRREALIGQHVTFKHQRWPTADGRPPEGRKPRSPVFKGFRDPRDMS